VATDIGVRLGVDGEKAFRASINAINANIKAMGAELNAVTAQFVKNAKSEEALVAKNEVLAKSIAATKDKISVLDKQLERQTDKLRMLGDALDDVVKAHGRESQEALNAQNAYNTQAKAVAKLQEQLSGAKAELAGMENAVRDNQDAIDGLGREVEDAGEALEEAGKNAISFGDILKANIISDFVVDGIRHITDGLKDFGRFSLESGMNFEAQMSRVQAISGATAEDAGRLADKAKEMGESTVFSATESAQALEYMAMAGWKTDDMLEGLAGIMNLAAASGEDLAATSDIVTDALTAFGLTAADSTHFADVLAVASSNANTNVGMMGETFKYVAPVAGALGYNVEDVALAVGLMANNGIKASQAGTSLRGALTHLAKPTENVWIALSDLGLALSDTTDDFEGVTNNLGEYNAVLYNSDGTAKSFSATISALRDAFSELSEGEKTYYASTLFGTEAMSGMLGILNASDDEVQKLTDAIYNADGAAQEMAETMTDNLSGSLTLMQSAAEGIGIAIYEKVQEPLNNFAADINNNVLPSIKNMITGEGTIQDVGRAIGDFISKIPEEFEKAFPYFEQAFRKMILDLSEGIKREFPNVISSALDGLANIAESIRENAGVMVDSGIAIVTSLAQGLADSFPSIIEKLPGIISDIAGVINDNASKILAAGVNIVVTLGKGLIQAIPTLISNIPVITRAIWDTISAFNWLNLGKNIITALGNGVKNMAGFAKTSAGQIKETIKSKISELPSELFQIGKNMIQKLWDGITSMGSWLKQKLGGFISNAINSVTGNFSKSTSNSGSGARRSSAAAPAAMAVWEPEAEPNPAPFRVARFGGGGLIPQTLTRSLSETEAEVRTATTLRRVQRDMTDTGASVAAYYTAPERRSGGDSSSENTWNGMDYRTVVSALQEAMEKMNINLDGRTVGRMTAKQQNNMGRAFGTV